MGNTLVLVLTTLVRRTPTRPQASTLVLASLAGTALLGVVLPAALQQALDPFPLWLVPAALTVVAAAVLGWRWSALPSGRGGQPGLVLTSCVLLGVLALAGVAVT